MPVYCAFLKECNNDLAYNEAVEKIPMRVVLSARTTNQAHSLAYIVQGIRKQIERLDVIGDETVLPVYTAISFMMGSVSF